MQPMKRALVIVAQDGYQDTELEGVVSGLEEADFTPAICSKEAGECKGKLGGKKHALIAMKDVDITDYNRVVFIGGPGMAAYASDGDALNLAVSAVKEGIPVGAICIAPTILAKAKILEGKNATVWHSDESVAILKQNGAYYTGDDVTVDGKIVTANGPDAAIEFGKTIASASLV